MALVQHASIFDLWAAYEGELSPLDLTEPGQGSWPRAAVEGCRNSVDLWAVYQTRLPQMDLTALRQETGPPLAVQVCLAS